MSFISNDALRIFGHALGSARTIWSVDEARAAMAGAGDLDPDRTESVLEQLQALRPGDETDRLTIGTLRSLLLRVDDEPEVPPVPAPARRPRSGPDAVAGLPSLPEPSVEDGHAEMADSDDSDEHDVARDGEDADDDDDADNDAEADDDDDPEGDGDADGDGERTMECLRCGTTMESLEAGLRFMLGGGPRRELTLDVIFCPACGKVEFFTPEQSA